MPVAYVWEGIIDGDISKAGNYNPVGSPASGDTVLFEDNTYSSPDSGILSGGIVTIKMTIYGGDFRAANSVTINDALLANVVGGDYNAVNQAAGYVNGGNFYGTLTSAGEIGGGIFFSDVISSTTIGDGTFWGYVENNGNIVSGDFKSTGSVLNNSTIEGGYFYGKITHNGTKIVGYFNDIKEIIFLGSQRFTLKKGLNNTEILSMG